MRSTATSRASRGRTSSCSRSNDFDVEIDPSPAYLTQIAGPTSLETLERAADESLRDIGFLRFRDVTIAGRTVEVGRIGMSGNLAYEVRGPLEDGPEIYDASSGRARTSGSSVSAGRRTSSTTSRAASRR